MDNTKVRGNLHNSGNWNLVDRNKNSPTTTVNSYVGSEEQPVNVSSVNSSVTGRNFMLELELIRERVQQEMRLYNEQTTDIVQGPISHELDIAKQGLIGKVKLGFKYLDSKLCKVNTIYLKYEEIGRRKLFWILVEKGRGEYCSYNDFKNNWDSNIKLWKQIKNELKVNIKDEIKELVDIKRLFDRPLDNSHKYPLDNKKYRR